MTEELNFELKSGDKTCNACKVIKRLADFYFCAGKPQGRCKDCVNAAARSRYRANGGKETARARYQANPELQAKARARSLERWKANKEESNERRRKRRQDPEYKEKEREQGRRYWKKKTEKQRETRDLREYERLKAKFEDTTKG